MEKKSIKVKQPTIKKNTEDYSLLESLLNKTQIQIPKNGDLVKGNVIDIGKNSIYIDLGILGTGLIMGREMKDGLGIVENLKKGDEIEATVIEEENEDGYMELSLREAGYEKIWEELERKKSKEDVVETKILAANRGGLMVEINGITGFLPVSQLSNENYPRVEDGDKNKILQLLNKFIDQTIKVRIIDIDKEKEKLIVSEKAIRQEEEKAEIKKYKIGDIIEGIISGIVDFGVFVKFFPKGKEEGENDSKKVLEGLIHISELAWQLIDNPNDIVKIGEKVKCKIIGIDNNRISFSMRALKKDPWSNIEKKYKAGDIIEGEITKLNPFGAFVQLDKNIHGLSHISELNRYFKNKNIEEVLRIGEKRKFKILSIDPRNHRMGLSPSIKDTKEKSETEKIKKVKELETKKTEIKKEEPAATSLKVQKKTSIIKKKILKKKVSKISKEKKSAPKK